MYSAPVQVWQQLLPSREGLSPDESDLSPDHTQQAGPEPPGFLGPEQCSSHTLLTALREAEDLFTLQWGPL